jgi:hypothetical protein
MARPIGPSVYRIIHGAGYADSLAAGEVYLSTLSECRKHEDPERGDTREAKRTYHTGPDRVFGKDAQGSHVFKQLGPRVFSGPVDGVSLADCSATVQILDAFVLCTSAFYLPDDLASLGKQCVRIDRPRQFFEIVTREVAKKYPIGPPDIRRVIYAPRDYSGMESPSGDLGFVKPPDPYAKQREVRMLWVLSGKPRTLKPEIFHCPEVAHLCTRIR